MSQENLSVGDNVWDTVDPTIYGTITSFANDGTIIVKTNKKVFSKHPNNLTRNPQIIIDNLFLKLQQSEETIKELRDNYWNVHQELLKMK